MLAVSRQLMVPLKMILKSSHERFDIDALTNVSHPSPILGQSVVSEVSFV
jgi:hypothetical protein